MVIFLSEWKASVNVTIIVRINADIPTNRAVNLGSFNFQMSKPPTTARVPNNHDKKTRNNVLLFVTRNLYPVMYFTAKHRSMLMDVRVKSATRPTEYPPCVIMTQKMQKPSDQVLMAEI